MSKIIGEGRTCLFKLSSENIYIYIYILNKVQLKNAFVSGLTQNYIQ